MRSDEKEEVNGVRQSIVFLFGKDKNHDTIHMGNKVCGIFEAISERAGFEEAASLYGVEMPYRLREVKVISVKSV